MKRKILLALFTILIGTFVLAEEFTVTYMTGYASIITGSREEPIDIGASLPDKARISIEDGGILELAGGSRNLTLMGPGTYELQTVLGRDRTRNNLPLGTLLKTRLSRLVSNDEVAKPSTAMGVRGAAVDEGELTWMSGESDASIEAGRAWLQDEAYARAAEEFRNGLETARDFGEFEAEMELSFLLSYTLYLEGETGAALASLNKIVPDPYAPWYPEYRLHHAKLLLDAGAPGRAVSLLRSEENSIPLGEEGRLLLGMALVENGDQDAGLEILKQLSKTGGVTARIARDYLRG